MALKDNLTNISVEKIANIAFASSALAGAFADKYAPLLLQSKMRGTNLENTLTDSIASVIALQLFKYDSI